MKKNTLYLITILLLMNSCAMIMRKRSTGDTKSGFNLVTTCDKPIIIKADGNTLDSKLFFDAKAQHSKFKVYKYYLPKMYKEVKLTLSSDSKEKQVTLYREKEKGWFWVDGAVVWLYEALTGKLYYYNDVNADEEFAKR